MRKREHVLKAAAVTITYSDGSPLLLPSMDKWSTFEHDLREVRGVRSHDAVWEACSWTPTALGEFQKVPVRSMMTSHVLQCLAMMRRFKARLVGELTDIPPYAKWPRERIDYWTQVFEDELRFREPGLSIRRCLS